MTQTARATEVGNVVPTLNSLIDNLGPLLRAKWGTATCTWPGGQQFSNSTEITHNLGVPAQLRLAVIDGLGIGTPIGAAPVVYPFAGTTIDKMKFQAVTTDGSSPANGTTVNFWWFIL